MSFFDAWDEDNEAFIWGGDFGDPNGDDPDTTPFGGGSAWQGMPAWEDLMPVARSYMAQFAEGTGKSPEELYDEIVENAKAGGELEPCKDCAACKHNARLDNLTYGDPASPLNRIRYEAHYLMQAWDTAPEQDKDDGLTDLLEGMYPERVSQDN